MSLDALLDAGQPETPVSRGRSVAGVLLMTTALTALVIAVVAAVVGAVALTAFLLWFRL